MNDGDDAGGRDGPSRRRSTRSRRDVLHRAAVGALGVGAGGLAGGTVGASPADVTLSFEDQTTDGRGVVIAELTAPRDVTITVATDGHETIYARRELPAGSYTDHAVTFDTLLTEDLLLEVSVYPGDGEALAMDKAEITVADDVTFVDGLPVTRVDADPDAGFNYPYFLSAPQSTEREAGGPVLVEPNNTGTSSDDLAIHVDRARKLAEGEWNGGSGRELSERLAVPFLVPAFPRPESDPVDWRHYVHQLDTETMRIDDGPLERVDRQLVNMIEHARERLREESYPVADDGMLLNGFSASGNFVNRFAALQPEEVVSVTAGGINGMAVLPLSEAKGHTLNYQIGVADVEDLTGAPFDLDAFREVNQFLYMGALDTNDTLPYDDAWSETQQAVALDVYGPNMQRDRLPFCESVYEDRDVSAAFKIYEGEGHTPTPAIDDMVEFHRASIAGEPIDGFGGNVGESDGGEGAPPEPVVEYSPTEPAAGDLVEFDASDSSAPLGDIVAYTWAFGDGETAAEPRPSHTYAERGGYTVTLTAIDGDGRTGTATTEVQVRPSVDATEATAASPTRDASGTETATARSTDGSATDRPTASAADGPGLGIVAALGGLGGLGGLGAFRRRGGGE
ncbi:PKD domain-containing protein [Halosimplex litoreum]|uniref:PKD domain-containing protein n=1 Tax=Halosimplex litoreum TaxID=1198301 RepID=A0A7T3G0A7_9EURY|nr:PKD domain-containing protein [Halosimplex litoreum]QPV64024.1 PKD domain-containing protein [Halosimplex litoreum]